MRSTGVITRSMTRQLCSLAAENDNDQAGSASLVALEEWLRAAEVPSDRLNALEEWLDAAEARVADMRGALAAPVQWRAISVRDGRKEDGK